MNTGFESARRGAFDRGVSKIDDADMNLDPVPGLLIVACFVLLFASAALHKLRDAAEFDAAFAAYELLPRAARRYGARAVPWLELAVAIGLLARATRPLAAVTGSVLLLTYALAIAINLRRGRLELLCGCGGADQRRAIGAWMVWRNLGLGALLMAALWPWSARALSTTDVLTIVFGAGASVLMYLCLDELGQVLRRAADLPGSR